MGTRNLTVVVQNNTIRVAQYCQWDGYPSGKGVDLLEFLRDTMNDEFKKHVAKCTWITPEEHQDLWVQCGASPDSDFVNMDTSEKFKERFFWLHRDCGPQVLEIIQNNEHGLMLQNSIEFAASFSCEWAYVVDLDQNTLEVYSYTEDSLTPQDRFYFLQTQENDTPVKMLKSYSLESLPTNEQFIADFTPDE